MVPAVGDRLGHYDVTALIGERGMRGCRGPGRDAFLFLLFAAITQIEKPLVQPCGQCQTLFRVEHKRQYCSPRCANRASMDAWKSRQGESGGRSPTKRKPPPATTS